MHMRGLSWESRNATGDTCLHSYVGNDMTRNDSADMTRKSSLRVNEGSRSHRYHSNIGNRT
jgi:ribosomal protein S3AE